MRGRKESRKEGKERGKKKEGKDGGKKGRKRRKLYFIFSATFVKRLKIKLKF